MKFSSRNRGVFLEIAQKNQLPAAQEVIYGAKDGMVDLRNACKSCESGGNPNNLPCITPTQEDRKALGQYVLSGLALVECGIAYWDPVSGIGTQRDLSDLRVLPPTKYDTECLSNMCGKPTPKPMRFVASLKRLSNRVLATAEDICPVAYADTSLAKDIGTRLEDYTPGRFVQSAAALKIMAERVMQVKEGIPQKIWYGYPESTDPILSGNMYGIFPQAYYAENMTTYGQKATPFADLELGQWVHVRFGGAKKKVFYSVAEYPTLQDLITEIAAWVAKLDKGAFTAIFGTDNVLYVTANTPNTQVAMVTWFTDTDETPDDCTAQVKPTSETLPQYWDETPLTTLKWTDEFTNKEDAAVYISDALKKAKRHFSKVLGKGKHVRNADIVIIMNDELYSLVRAGVDLCCANDTPQALANKIDRTMMTTYSNWCVGPYLRDGDFLITLRNNIRLVTDGTIDSLEDTANFTEILPSQNCRDKVEVITKLPLNVVIENISLIAVPLCGNPSTCFEDIPYNVAAGAGCFNCMECKDEEATGAMLDVSVDYNITAVEGVNEKGDPITTIEILLDAEGPGDIAYSWDVQSSLGQLNPATITSEGGTFVIDGHVLPVSVNITGNVTGSTAGVVTWTYVMNTSDNVT